MNKGTPQGALWGDSDPSDPSDPADSSDSSDGEGSSDGGIFCGVGGRRGLFAETGEREEQEERGVAGRFGGDFTELPSGEWEGEASVRFWEAGGQVEEAGDCGS